MGRRAGLLTGAAALGLNLACYAYKPVVGVPLAESQEVRVHLTSEGTTELARYLGPRVSVAAGTLANLRPDGALGVAVRSVELGDGVRQHWSGEGIVTFPQQLVSRVERRELSKSRTAFGAVALAVGLFAIAAIALKATGSQGGGEAPGGTPTQ